MIRLKDDFQMVEAEMPEIHANEALVKVSGCGVCHTDLSFWNEGVKTKRDLPLTLGHEISGIVLSGPDFLVGRSVIIPAVLPCGNCELCNKGRSNICQNQKMPGNDFHGGFASHIVVPSQYLCPVPDVVLSNYRLEELAVIADAISTPYQVIRKSELDKDDFAICIGVGGVGIYGALMAKIMGAKVLAIDINDSKLEQAKMGGVDAVLNSAGLDIKDLKSRVRDIAVSLEAPRYGWKIFEFSGTTMGQELAFNLITFSSTMSVVGFTMSKLEIRLSNLMAFDAKLIGTWGCRPELYPEVLELISSGSLKIRDYIQLFPMSRINEVFHNTLAHKYSKRTILVPDFESIT